MVKRLIIVAPVVAVVAAAGVYASSLSLIGRTGTDRGAGADTDVESISGCQTSSIVLRPVYASELDRSGGYIVDFSHWEMSGVDSGCAGKRINVGIRMDKGFIAAGGPISLTGASTYTVAGKEPTSQVTGYTLKILPNGRPDLG